MSEKVEHNEQDIKTARELVIEIFQDRFQRARKKAEFEEEFMRDAEDVRDFLIDRDTRTFCIISVSFVEDILKRTFEHYWNIQGKEKRDGFFGSNGPLNTFSQRSLVAAGCGWISKESAAETALLRKIRNEFAHNHRIHSLDQEPVRSWISAIPAREEAWNQSQMSNYVHALSAASQETRYRMRLYCASMYVVGSTLARSKLIKEEPPPEFRYEKGYDGLTDIEQACIDHTIKHCFRTIGITRSSPKE
ncbi:hypothetical protein ACQEPB_11005 [Novosphingobium fluoreni]|uniref:hypothetical protein n=1 Tax=Novosphingobium fluoreni TaxID=1391222 RepID=UPI003DA154D3